MSDLISRQQVIDALMNALNDVGVLDADDINTVFQMLPPAEPAQPEPLQPWEVLAAQAVLSQPEIIQCKDCKHRDPEDKKCDCGHDIEWQLPRRDDWYCADGERSDA